VSQRPLKGGRSQVLGQRLAIHPQTHKVEDAGQIFTIATGKLVVNGGLLFGFLHQ